MVSLKELKEFKDLNTPRDYANHDLKKLEKKYPTLDLDDLISELWGLINSGIYDDLLETLINWEEPVTPFSNESAEIAAKTLLIVIAHENLTHNPPPFRSDLISYINFKYLFPFLQWVYSMNLKRPLTPEDVRKIFLSGIGEKLIFFLEDFDQIKETPQTTPKFFQKLRKLKWKDKKAKEVYKKLSTIIMWLAFNKFGTKEGSLSTRQDMIILFIAGCNTLKHERNRIIAEDVITAYRVLFKIIKTDLTKLIQ
jgi:hypothetical protein